MNANASIVSKVLKLLATARDTAATANEVAVAMRLADRLCAQHRVSAEDLAAAAAGQAPRGTRAEDLVQTKLRVVSRDRERGWLAMAAALATGCRAFRGHDGATWAFGLPVDVAVCVELDAWVVGAMRTAVAAFAADRGVSRGSREARSFARGFATAVYNAAKREHAERLRSQEPIAPAAPAPAGALVLVVGEQAQLHERALAVRSKQMGLVQRRSSAVRSDGASYSAGHAAGQRVRLSREVLS